MARGPTPLGALARGVVAGVAGTAAMTAWQQLSSRLQGEDDRAAGGSGDPWEEAPAPAKVGKRLVEVLFRTEVPPERIPLLTNLMHWGYGTSWGAAYGLLQASLRTRPLRHGLFFGAALWGMSYAQLVPLGIYGPPWKYAPGELLRDLSYHLVYGAGAAAAYDALD